MDLTRNVIGENIIYHTSKILKNYSESLRTISPCHRLSTSYDYIYIFVCVCVRARALLINSCAPKKKKTRVLTSFFFFSFLNIFRVQLCLLHVLIKKFMFSTCFFFSSSNYSAYPTKYKIIKI